jgi:hypothetical protein
MVGTVLMGRQRRAAWLCSAFVVLGIGTMPAAAQTPSAAQIEAYKSLPPAQQQELLKQFGITTGPMGPQPSTTTQPTSQLREGAVPIGVPLPPIEGETLDTEPRLRAGDWLLVDVTELTGPDLTMTPPPVAAAIAQGIEEEVNRTFVEFQRGIHNGNPYRLDRAGRLLLPGQIAITLAGLTTAEAEERLNADPRLESMAVWLRPLHDGADDFRPGDRHPRTFQLRGRAR